MENTPFRTERVQKSLRFTGIAIIIGIFLFFSFRKTENMTVIVKDESIFLSHSSGETVEIQLTDIQSVNESSSLNIGQYVSGIDSRRFKFGVWSNSEWGEYHLCVYSEVMRTIIIETRNGFCVMNFESEETTDSFYNAFTELLRSLTP